MPLETAAYRRYELNKLRLASPQRGRGAGGEGDSCCESQFPKPISDRSNKTNSVSCHLTKSARFHSSFLRARYLRYALQSSIALVSIWFLVAPSAATLATTEQDRITAALKTWKAVWSPYRIIDNEGVERRLIKAIV